MGIDRRTFLIGLGALAGGAKLRSRSAVLEGDETRGWQVRPLRRGSGVVESLEDGRLCLGIDAHSEEKACVLNETGREIWALVDGRRSCDEIVVALARRHALSEPAEIESVRGFVSNLVAHQLVAVS